MILEAVVSPTSTCRKRINQGRNET